MRAEDDRASVPRRAQPRHQVRARFVAGQHLGLVDAELIRQAAVKLKIKVADSEVDDALREYKKPYRNEAHFQSYLKRAGETVASIREQLKNKLRAQKVLAAREGFAVTDADAKAYFEKNRHLFQQRAGIRARHILVMLRPKPSPAQTKAAMAKIARIQSALKTQKFEDVAKKFSEGPSSRRGGDLGFFARGQMVKPFEAAAYKLKMGEVSQPVLTKFGYHIIKVTGKRQAGLQPFESVKAGIKRNLHQKRFYRGRGKMLMALRSEAKIKNHLAAYRAASRNQAGAK